MGGRGRTERGVEAEKRGHPTFLDLQTVRKGETVILLFCVSFPWGWS